MKIIYIILALLGIFLFNACTGTVQQQTPQKTYTRFQSVPLSQAILLQHGNKKEDCIICGMHLPTFYKTNHAATTKDHQIRQYCSLHCVVHDNEINKTDLYDVKVVDVTTLKFISAQSAYYVVGSMREGTMSHFSKYAFAKRKNADAFVKKYGGHVMNFYDAYTIAMQDFMTEE
ncbi:nitrous oxide reductase accessory protein NosL [Sulfurovum sp. zt1-1]|uniref:Nitrous oxide reductase accessory protein NosL n=1 Tax=Sulfurovum zhangzhouensis TaxID=3019067 RepID=A0ABT7R034_9BACT|nr:nitrous oxide reductase accessory protein NosL [Sulfurovum zhangzhouensis]MDM5272465.1 nitrous oxide reductase accessory protein NosL [Sulfurovum zhangzhouensis]